MASLVEAWPLIAMHVGPFLQCYDPNARYAGDSALVTLCLRQISALSKVQVYLEWMVAIRDSQSLGDFRCRTLVLPCFVLRDIVMHAEEQLWTHLDSHPALVSPRVFINLLLQHLRSLRAQQHTAYAQWEMGADLLITDKDMRHLFMQSIVSLTVFRQAAMDQLFLALHCALTSLHSYRWQLSNISCIRDMAVATPGHRSLLQLQSLLTKTFGKARRMCRPLTWEVDSLGWQIPLHSYTAPAAIRSWIAMDFQLSPVGHFVGVATSKCLVPLGIKIPRTLLHEHRVSIHARRDVEDAFFEALHQQQNAPPWLGCHPLGWIMFQWILHWHPLHDSPMLHRRCLLPALQLARTKWYRSRPYSNAHTFQCFMPGPWSLQ